jgi:hypothetical protein
MKLTIAVIASTVGLALAQCGGYGGGVGFGAGGFGGGYGGYGGGVQGQIPVQQVAQFPIQAQLPLQAQGQTVFAHPAPVRRMF